MSLRHWQGLNALIKLVRGPCASNSGGLLCTFRHFAATAGASVDDSFRKPSQGRDSEGAKAVLIRILESAETPLTSDAVWAKAKEEGLPSKNFTKKMLQEMKQWGRVLVKPGKPGASFEYRLHADYKNALPPEQKQPKAANSKPRRPNLDNPEVLVELPTSSADEPDWLLGEAPAARTPNERRTSRAPYGRPPVRAPYGRPGARAPEASRCIYLGKKHKVDMRPISPRSPSRKRPSQEAGSRKPSRGSRR